jgi:hypothetical protein
MSKYRTKPYNLDAVKNYPLSSRSSKVSVENFSRAHRKGSGVAEFLVNLPDILGAQNLKTLVHAIINAQGSGRAIVWGIGGHVIKTGLGPVLIDLMDRGFVSAVAMNGSCLIHDYEIAVAGSTSEDVDAQLPSGAFGMAEETGRDINAAIKDGNADGLGIGESMGRFLAELRPAFGRYSLLQQAYLRNIPVTVHVTIGADIVHNHPSVSPSAIGESSHRDFRLLASLIAELDGGGVYLNCGSAVTLPEVFLKCVTLLRNSGKNLSSFTTANLDFIQHYRPTENVVRRPIQDGGRGIAITGHHELLIPLLAAWLVEISPDIAIE